MLLYELLVAVDLLRPVGVDVLAVTVDERQVILGAGDLLVVLRFPFQADIGDSAVDQVLPGKLERPLKLEFDRIDLRGVEHAHVLAAFGSEEERCVRQVDAHRALFTRIQADAGIDLAVGQVDMAAAFGAALAA